MAKPHDDKPVLRSFLGRIDEKGVDKKARTVEGYGSTGTIDRYGEVVLPDAFEKDLQDFLDHRHLFAAGHRYVSSDGEPLIIGKITEASIVPEKGLKMKAAFDEDELAEKWWNKYKIGTLNAFSIGFIPRKSEYRKLMLEDESGTKKERSVLHYTEVELLEISAVPIPANRESMVANALEDIDPELLTELAERLKKSVAEEVAKKFDALHSYQKEGFEQMLDLLHAIAEKDAHSREVQPGRKQGEPKLTDADAVEFRKQLGLA